MSTASANDPRSPAPRPEPSAEDGSLDAPQKRLADADAQAFETIFRRLSEPVFRYVRRMVSDDAQAHDITQDTFAKLWSMREQVASVDSLRAYVFRMARNRVYNQQRNERTRRKHHAQLQEEPPHATPSAPDQVLDADLLEERLHDWIEDLPNRQRETLTLRRQQGLSHDEIAAIMDISPHTVNNHIVRALQQLRKRLRAYRPDLFS
jgi:RNA polymerase sigma-70 factor (ECF subfamily)